MSVRSELQRLYDRDGFLNPEQILAEATPEDSALHARFEWDDSEAARKFRLHQAGDLIRRVKVKYHRTPDELINVRSYVSVTEPGESSRYVSAVDAVSDPDHRDIVISQAMRDLAALRAKYESLVGLAQWLDLLAQAQEQTAA